jgi:hypothetical protein
MYYTYILKNPITDLPFYVGVGKENRKASSRREEQHTHDAIRLREGKKLKKPNKHKLNTILQILDQGLEVLIVIDSRFEIETDAFNKEIKLIAHYGRRDLGTGILTNLTDGGEGRINPSKASIEKQSKAMLGRPSPLKGKLLGPYSEERRKHISDATKGRVSPAKGKIKGPLTPEHKEKISNALKGRVSPRYGKTLTPEHKEKISKANKGKAGFWTGKSAPNKGVPSGKKGLTYEEMYGVEKAAEIKEKRRLKKLEYWQNKKVKISSL